MASITRVSIKKCGMYDQLLDVKCNQPRHHDDDHRFSDGPDLQFTWLNAEKQDTTENSTES